MRTSGPEFGYLIVCNPISLVSAPLSTIKLRPAFGSCNKSTVCPKLELTYSVSSSFLKYGSDIFTVALPLLLVILSGSIVIPSNVSDKYIDPTGLELYKATFCPTSSLLVEPLRCAKVKPPSTIGISGVIAYNLILLD